MTKTGRGGQGTRLFSGMLDDLSLLSCAGVVFHLHRCILEPPLWAPGMARLLKTLPCWFWGVFNDYIWAIRSRSGVALYGMLSLLIVPVRGCCCHCCVTIADES